MLIHRYSLSGYIVWISITGCLLSCFLLIFAGQLYEYVDLRTHPEKRGKLVTEDNAQGGIMPTTEMQTPAQPPPYSVQQPQAQMYSM